MISTDWDTGRVDLGVTWVGKSSAALVSPVGSRDIAPHRIRREVENVSVTTAGENNCISRMAGYFAGK